jgi:ComF family protein
VVFRDALDALTSIVFPAECRICDRTLAGASLIPICPSCINGFQRITPPVCHCCGRPFGPLETAAPPKLLCHLCRLSFYAFDRARSFGVYDDGLSEAILLLKYEDITRLGAWFAAQLAEMVLATPDAWPADLVVPVPVYSERRRERGYNQAETIARPLAKRLKLKLEPHMLVRTRPRPPQLLLTRVEHWESVRGAYATPPGLKVDNLRILLVDDVLTTGATLDACSRALKAAGAASVLGLTVARARFSLVAAGPVEAPKSREGANQTALTRI